VSAMVSIECHWSGVRQPDRSAQGVRLFVAAWRVQEYGLRLWD
jgi:hypothetical protein